MAELKATPRNAALGAIADALVKAREFGDKAKIPFTELGLGELLLGKTPEELNEWSYGNAPLRVAGRGTGSRVPQLKQGRAEQFADTIFTLPGAGPLARASARAVTAVPRAVRHGAEQFAHASAAANPRVVKETGGNWLHSEGTEYLDDLLQKHARYGNVYSAEQQAFEAANPNAAAVNNWVRGPLTKYTRQHLGAETDPLLKLADEGISPLSRDELLNPDLPSLANRRRKKAGLSQPDLGGYQQGWADRADAMVFPQEIGGLRTGLGDQWEELLSNPEIRASVINDYWPELVQREGAWLGKLSDDAKVYQFSGDEAPYHLGLDRTVDALRKGLTSADLPPHLALSPEKLKQMGIEKAVRYQNELDTFLKNRDIQELLEAGRSPSYGGKRLKEFDNGYYITELGLPEALTEDMQKLVRQNPDGTWTALSPSGRPMQRRLTPGTESPLVDVVEDTPERAILGGMLGHEGRIMDHCVGGYCGEVARGGTRVLSYRGPDGKSHVTLDIEQGIPAELRDRAQQAIRAYENYDADLVSKGKAFDALDFPTWLEENYPDLLEHGPELFENGASSPIVRQVYGAANSTPKPEYQAPIGQYLREAQLYGDDYTMKNAGLYPVRTRNAHFTKDELRQLVDEGDVDAKAVWDSEFGDWEAYKEGGLVEADDDFAYPGML